MSLPQTNLTRWTHLWQALSATGSAEPVYAELVQRWSEPHRHYHNLQHLNECLGLLDEYVSHALQPAALETVNIFVCIGTSGVVYPAAGIARQAASKGAKRLIEINLDDTDISTHFTEHRHGSTSVEVPKLVEELILSIPHCLR